jgi:hypothetical protein
VGGTQSIVTPAPTLQLAINCSSSNYVQPVKSTTYKKNQPMLWVCSCECSFCEFIPLLCVKYVLIKSRTLTVAAHTATCCYSHKYRPVWRGIYRRSILAGTSKQCQWWMNEQRVCSTGHENWCTCRNTWPVPLPFCPPQNPHELLWNWKWASTVRGQRMLEPQHSLHTTYWGRCCIYPHTRQLIFPQINHLKNWLPPYDHAQLNTSCQRIVLHS